eukprot:scaffold247811_cov24-Tisochrysis_lutea.AAC.1
MQQLARDVEQLLQLSGALELGLLALGVLVLLEERQQGLRRGVQLEFLLGSAVCGGARHKAIVYVQHRSAFFAAIPIIPIICSFA